MARVRPGAQLPGRVKSLRGAVYYRVWRGVAIACKWPSPRGKPKTPEHRQQVAWFTQAQKLANRVDAKTQMTIRQAVHRTPLMPRDAATSLMAGRMFALRGGENLFIRSRRAMSEVSRSLDVISNIPGQTLIRGPDFWQGQAPVATAGGWIQPMPELGWTLGVSGGSLSWLGSIVAPAVPISITRIAAIVEVVLGGTWQGAVARLDESNAIVEWSASATTTPATIGRQLLTWDLATVLAAGERYALLAGRIDAPDGTRAQIAGIANGSYPWPGTRSRFGSIFEATPGIGSTVSDTGAGCHAVNVFASF